MKTETQPGIKSEFIVRRACVNDARALFALHCRVEEVQRPIEGNDPWPGERLDSLLDRGPWTDPLAMEIHLRAMLDNSEALVLVAQQRAAETAESPIITGTLEAFIDPPGSHEQQCFLSVLYLDPLVRGQGLGRALMDSLSEELARSGLAEMAIVTEPSGQATAFYERLGFQYSGQALTLEADREERDSDAGPLLDLKISPLLTPAQDPAAHIPGHLLENAPGMPISCGLSMSRGWILHRLLKGFPAPAESGVRKLLFWSHGPEPFLGFIEAVEGNPVTPEIYALGNVEGFELLTALVDDSRISALLQTDSLRAALRPWTRGKQPDREMSVLCWHSLFRLAKGQAKHSAR